MAGKKSISKSKEKIKSKPRAKKNSVSSSEKKMRYEFISATSHQFRTPLATLQSSVDLLEFYIKKGSTSRQTQIINKIKRSVKNLLATLDKITHLYKYESGKQKLNIDKFDLRRFVNEILEEVVVDAESSHFINVNIDSADRFIFGDPFILKHILINLLSNAIKFSPEGGQIQLSIKQTKNNFEFSVKDEGIGISNKDMNSLYEPFFRGANTELISGDGLGLAIVKNLAKIHKSKIECRSELGRGTEFNFKIKSSESK